MRPRRRPHAQRVHLGLLPAVTGCAFVALACTGGSSVDVTGGEGSDSGADSAADAEAGPDPYSFDPSRYRRDCERDEDCVVLLALSRCSSCCGYASLRRGDAERDHAAVETACQSPGSPLPHGICGLYCPPPHAACFEQSCVRVYPDAGPP